MPGLCPGHEEEVMYLWDRRSGHELTSIEESTGEGPCAAAKQTRIQRDELAAKGRPDRRECGRSKPDDAIGRAYNPWQRPPTSSAPPRTPLRSSMQWYGWP